MGVRRIRERLDNALIDLERLAGVALQFRFFREEKSGRKQEQQPQCGVARPGRNQPRQNPRRLTCISFRANAQSLPRVFLADFPDKAVQVVVQQACRRDDGDNNTDDSIVLKQAPGMSERSESQAHAHVHQNEERAGAE